MGEPFAQARADDFSEHGIAAVERVRVQVPAACPQAIASPFRHGLIVNTRVEEPESGHRGLQSAVAPARSGLEIESAAALFLIQMLAVAGGDQLGLESTIVFPVAPTYLTRYSRCRHPQDRVLP